MLKKTTRGMTAAMTRRGVGFAVAGGGAGYDSDAQAYITLVEAADSQSLETGVKDAINAFVVGCKSDGIWDAIKAACILAGARTLTGALVPLVGTAPTNNNFVSGDYNRETGLVGNGSTKYLDSNRACDDDPQNSYHMAVYVTQTATAQTAYAGATGSLIRRLSTGYRFQSRSSSTSENTTGGQDSAGFVGSSRSSAAEFIARSIGANTTLTQSSSTPSNTSTSIFSQNVALFSNGKIAFYSIGESLDLALLDSRVSTLMTAIGAAIP